MNNGYLDVMKWLYEHCGVNFFSSKALDNAISNNQLDIVKWIYQTFGKQYFEYRRITTDDYDMIVFLHETCEIPVTDLYVKYIVVNGNNLESVKYVLEKSTGDCGFDLQNCKNSQIVDYICEKYPSSCEVEWYRPHWAGDYLRIKYPNGITTT